MRADSDLRQSRPLSSRRRSASAQSAALAGTVGGVPAAEVRQVVESRPRGATARLREVVVLDEQKIVLRLIP